MTEIERIRDLLHRALHGGSWHGPALLETLAGLNAAEASARPLPGAHTVAEIAAHADAWQRIVAERLEAGRTRPVSTEEDWPPPAAGEEAWSRVPERLIEGSRRLDERIASLPTERLDEIVPGSTSTYAVMLHGVVAHHLYHAGQIVLLRKALEPRRRAAEPTP